MWLSLILTLSSQVFIPLWLQSKESACNAGGKKDQVWPLDKEDPLEEEMATHSSILAWKNPLDGGASNATSMGLQRVGYDWKTFTAAYWPMPYDSENMIQFHKKHTTHSPTNAVYTDTSLLNMLVEDTRNDKMICCLSSVILAKNDKF